MNKLFILILMVSLLSAYVYADTYSVSLNYPDYMDSNATERIMAHAYQNNILMNDSQGYHLTLDFSGSITDMDYSAGYFYADLISTTEEDVLFNVSIRNDTTNVSQSFSSGMMRWRKPFYVVLNVFKSDGANTTDEAVPFRNEFAYVVMRKANLSMNILQNPINIDEWFTWMPGYGSVAPLTPRSIDQTESFWGRYQNGEATIKLYESGSYAIYVLTKKSISNMTWGYEFIYPQDSKTSVLGALVSNANPLLITEEDNQQYKIYATMWDINSINAMQDIGKYILFGIVWIGLIILMAHFSPLGAVVFAIAYWPVLGIVGWL